MKNISFQKATPYLAAILVFIVITFAFFSPLLEGKLLFQSDIAQYQGMSKEIVDYRSSTGQEPLWTNSMFGGMPAYQISANYTSNLVGYIDKVFTLGLPRPADMLFLYFIGFFFLLLVMKVDPWLSIAGAIGFAFSSFFIIIIDVGHNSQAHAIGYMAPVLAGFILTFRKRYLLGGLISAVFLSLEVKANHPQITYYLVMLALLLGISELVQAIRSKTYKPFFLAVGIIFLAGGFALATNITSLWATYEYGNYTIRGKSELTSDKHNRTSGLDKDYATQWSYGVGETMTLLIPNFYGGTDQKLSINSNTAKALRANNVPEENVRQFVDQRLPMYWGAQPFTAGPVYIGAIMIFLFVLGLLIVKGPLKWWLLAATVLSIILAWGHNFMSVTDFFFSYLPGYNKFRSVTMILVIAEFAVPLLGMLALKEFFDSKQDPKKITKKLFIAAGITGGIALIFALIPSIFLDFVGHSDAYKAKQLGFPDWLMQGLRDDRQSLLQADAWRTLLFIFLTAGVMFAVLYNKIRKEYAYLIIGVLILVDMYPIAKRYLNEESFRSKSQVATPYELSPADEQILQDKALDYRVLNLTVDPMNDASTSYFHKSIGGYHGAKLRRYQELYDAGVQKDIEVFARSMSTDSTGVLNMLNTKYFIVPDNKRQPAVFPNPKALGNAWFVKEVKLVDNADEEIKNIRNINPGTTALINKKFAEEVKGFSPGRDSTDLIRLDSYAPNDLQYSYKSRNTGLAVFSEIYYPKGWNAYVDGKLTPHFQADYVLRGMLLPAGEHKVEFKFEPAVYHTGEKISLISSILLILVVIGLAALEIRRSFASAK
ncbi:MAG: YfhO family protein [Bacteroidetes bacterium]|nr:YfhO family protein [Bacteroidota bacterium]